MAKLFFIFKSLEAQRGPQGQLCIDSKAQTRTLVPRPSPGLFPAPSGFPSGGREPSARDHSGENLGFPLQEMK